MSGRGRRSTCRRGSARTSSIFLPEVPEEREGGAAVRDAMRGRERGSVHPLRRPCHDRSALAHRVGGLAAFGGRNAAALERPVLVCRLLHEHRGLQATTPEEACEQAVEAANGSDRWKSLDWCGPTFVDAARSRRGRRPSAPAWLSDAGAGRLHRSRRGPDGYRRAGGWGRAGRASSVTARRRFALSSRLPRTARRPGRRLKALGVLRSFPYASANVKPPTTAAATPKVLAASSSWSRTAPCARSTRG